jgi:oligoribonuclease NrnB/cAMP/cGMP phosphodiesterase (DHH superfamily)
MSDVTVLYHRDTDGFGAAYAAWKKFGDRASFIGVQYSEPVPDIPAGTQRLFIVDFSYSEEIIRGLQKSIPSVVVLDHHKTALGLKDTPGCYIDLDKAGCWLAWGFFHDAAPMPDILEYVGDRDLWRFALPMSEDVNLYIASLPWIFEVWDDFCLTRALEGGGAIKAFRGGQIQSALRNVRMISLAGYEIPCINTADNISELGNEMCKLYPDVAFSASYCDRKDCRSWSLRSIGEFDVSTVAKHFGGGGHRNAAGFSTPLFWPETHRQAFYDAWERLAK